MSARGYGRGLPRPDPFFADVTLLLHCDGTPGFQVFPDNSVVNNTMTAHAGAVTQTTNSVRFGTTSLRMRNAGDGLTCPNTPFNFGTNDFTVEGWIYFDNAFTPDAKSAFFVNSAAATFFAGYGVSNANLTFGPTDTVGWPHGMDIFGDLWAHVAWVRHGANRTIYVNGVSIGSAADVGGVNFTPAAGTAYIGSSPLSGTPCCKGNLDDIRITNGVARYTANFGAPGAPFPNH